MEITNLKNSPQFYKDTLLLIEKCFHYRPEFNFSIDFYPLVSERNWQNCYIVINENKVVAHIGVKLRSLKDGTPIALIGGVVVDEEFRGHGLFSQLFNTVIDRIQNETAFVILWSELSEMYQKFGFIECGAVIQTGTKSFLPLMDFYKSTLENIDQNEFIQIQKLYQKSHNSIYRNTQDWIELSHIKSTDLYIHKNIDTNDIDAYLFVNKGMDLGDIIHEICFAPELEEEILAVYAQYQLWLPEKYETTFHTKKLFSGIYKEMNPTLFKLFLKNNQLPTDLKINEALGPNGKLTSFYISGLDSV